MASKKDLTILINAKDNASKTIKGVDTALSAITKAAKIAAVALGAAAGGFAYVLKSTTNASNELTNSMIGLNSVATALKQDADGAKKAAMELAADGLMSVKDAANSLKNLLGAGFNLEESTKLMYAFKDAAAFNRQGTLAFGQAIEGATQGIKNQNSILVDNAGITKNLSVILSEAGYSAQDLGKVASDVGVRTALYNGILKEAAVFQGDAARMSDTLAGSQAALSTKIFMLKAAIGEGLNPIMQYLIDLTNKLIDRLGGAEGLKAKAEKVTEAFFKLTGTIKTFVNKIQEAGGIINAFKEFVGYLKNKLTELLDFIDQKLGIVTIFKTAFEHIWLVFKFNLLPVLQEFFKALQPIMPFLKVFAKLAGVVLYGALIALVKLIEISLIATMQVLTNIIKIAIKGIDKFKSAWDTVTTVLSKVIGLIDRVINAIKKLNVLEGAKNFVGGVLGFGGGRAIGGPVSAGTSYLVGERGPEMFVPSTSGRIIPNAGGSLVINITGNTLLDSRAAEKMGNLIIQKLGFSTKI